MDGKFTQGLLSIVLSFFIGFLINPINVNAQNCAIPTGVSTSNVSNFAATINWSIDNNVDHYTTANKAERPNDEGYEEILKHHLFQFCL